MRIWARRSLRIRDCRLLQPTTWARQRRRWSRLRKDFQQAKCRRSVLERSLRRRPGPNWVEKTALRHSLELVAPAKAGNDKEREADKAFLTCRPAKAGAQLGGEDHA